MKYLKIGKGFSVIRNGATIKQDKVVDGTPITRIETIADGTVDLNRLGYASVRGEEFSEYYLQDGDILMSHINSVSHLGKVAIFENRKEKIIHGMNLLCLKTNPEILFPKYAFLFLKSSQFRSSIKKITKKSVNQASFNISNLKEIEIPLPPLPDQLYIANLLSKAENLIAHRKEGIRLLDEYLKSTFLEMFGDAVMNEKQWNKFELKNYAKVRIGPFGSLLHREDYIQNGIPLVNPSHIGEGKIFIDPELTISKNKMKELSAYVMHEGDVVLGRRGEIGRCAVVTKKEEGYLCGTGSIYIRPTAELNPIFLYNIISSASMRNVLENSAKGITMKNLNSGIIDNLKIPVPPIKLQTRFAQIVEKTEAVKTQYQQSLKVLENLYGSLSQRAFRGEFNLIG